MRYPNLISSLCACLKSIVWSKYQCTWLCTLFCFLYKSDLRISTAEKHVIKPVKTTISSTSDNYSDKSLKGIVLNLALQSFRGGSFEITRTFPLMHKITGLHLKLRVQSL